jgi:bifunctional non-homologous end joining protein LigD
MAKGASTKPARPTVAGVGISHPDRLIYPDLGVSKIQLARYYEAVAEWMVPHLAGRPLTLLHCPAGLAAPCHYLRHAKAWGPSALRRVRIQEKTKLGEYLIADNGAALVSLAQMGIVEIHTWNSIDDDIERPNRVIWDLDPGAAVTWSDVVAAARAVRAVLTTLELTSWVKTTGGRGLHIVVPITRHRDWSECLAFARNVAQLLERHDPARLTTALPKRGRQRKILIDYLRNNRTNTAVAAFSTRARPNATVSAPIAWDELGDTLPPFSLVSVPKRLARLRVDPWAGYWRSTQRISIKAFRAVENL